MAEDSKNAIVGKSFWFEEVHNNGDSEYVAGDAIGTVQSLNIRGVGGGGIIRVINVSNQDAIALALRIWFFRREPRAVTDNAAFLMHNNDQKKLAGWRDIPAGLYVTNGNLRIAHLPNANVDFYCPNGFLFYIVEARATGTYPTANRLEINMGDGPD